MILLLTLLAARMLLSTLLAVMMLLATPLAVMTLSAVLDPDSGELAWAREDDEGLVEARVLGTNQVSASLRCDTLYTTCPANFFLMLISNPLPYMDPLLDAQHAS